MTSVEALLQSLEDEEYRDIYVDALIGSTLAAQIRAIREQQGMTQADLGELAGMAQESISKLENPDYGKYTTSTLKRLASALHVAPVVRLASFGELAEWVTTLTPARLAPLSYEAELADRLKAVRVVSTTAATTWQGSRAVTSTSILVDSNAPFATTMTTAVETVSGKESQRKEEPLAILA